MKTGMTKKILAGVGLFALLAFTGTGVFAWWSVQQQLHITVSEEAEERGVSEIALLRDSVQSLGQNLESLRGSLGKSLGELASELDDAAAERSRELLAKISAEFAAQEACVARVEEGLTRGTRERQAASQRVEARLAALQTQLCETAKTGRASLASIENKSAELPDVSQAVTPAVEKMAANEELASKVAVSEQKPIQKKRTELPTPKKRRFLSFSLESQGLDFDSAGDFVLIPKLSRVGFDAKSTLHDFTGVTSKLAGELHAKLADPATGATGRIVVDATSLDTGLEGRDEAMGEHLATKEHTSITFELTGIEQAKVDAKARTVAGRAVGKMTIRGQTKNFAMPVRMVVDEAQRLVVDGQAPLDLPDYGVPVPNKLGLISMNKTVKVWIALRFRVQAKQ